MAEPDPGGPRWNRNTSFHGFVLGALPGGRQRVLDAGSGEGDLSRCLTAAGHVAVALERDPPTIDVARSYGDVDGIAFVAGDLRQPPFPPATFDAVVSIAVIHHVDERAALTQLATLLRPGGRLVVIAFTKPRSLLDLAYAGAGVVGARTVDRKKVEWLHKAPIVWPPPSSFRQLRRIASDVLPGVKTRRHVHWRCSLVWTKPG